MAYPMSFNHNKHSPQLNNEQQRSWLSRDPPRHQINASINSTVPSQANILDPESEDSDVSIVDGDYASAFALPISLPAAPPKQALENLETVSAHLQELERVEDHNVKKQKRLLEKRKRKDDRIIYRRAIQDEKIKAILDTRVRRDSRIKQRRAREDIAYTRFFEELEEVEARLRQRLKRLKRGLPVEEPIPTSRRVSINSANSMSPTGPSYSTIPPPAKRHQTSHPGNSELSLLNRPHDPHSHVAPPSTQPSYQFYPSSRPPPPPQHQLPSQLPPPPQYQAQPLPQPPHVSHPPPTTPYGMYAPAGSPPLSSTINITPSRHELNPYPTNGPHGSPHSSKLPLPSMISNPPPPRIPSANYDTRPPPPPGPPSSGFATINQPASTGFAAVNSKTTAAEAPIIHTFPSLDHSQSQEQQSTSVDRTPSRGPPSEDKSVTGGNGTNKRTPSTTHPYQMSEAFANRHHHCERIDTLNRGIWTWFGPGGTQENPASAPVEMYLKCNHDGCGRIDWRTVHGLQCHIVKNHEQPKGTIGSLEKALERYGVPVSHIEEIERRDGLGSGGTMADPKNFRIKSRMRDSGDRADFGRRHTPSGAPKSHTPTTLDSPVPFNGSVRPTQDTPMHQQSYREQKPKEGTAHSPIDLEKPSQAARPTGGFAAVNSFWSSINTPNGNPVANDKPELKDRTAPTWTEGVMAMQKSPSRDVQHVSLPSWHTAPQMKTPTVDNQPLQSDRSSHIQSQPTKNDTVVNAESPKTVEPVATDETLRNSLVSTDRDSRDTRHQTKDNDAQKLSEERAHLKTTETPLAGSRKGVEDTVMTDAKAEEATASASEVKPKNDDTVNPGNAHEPSEYEVSPRTNTEIPSTQSTPRRRREESKRDEEFHNSEQGHTRTTSTEEDSRMMLRSPEISQKRTIPSRRESRRSSMATAASSRMSTEKMKEDDNETLSSTAYTAASKADSIDDDSDSITVATRSVVDRQKDKDTPKRMANGRYARKR